MKSDIKHLLKHSSIYYLGSILSFLSSFITLPILTRSLSKSDYGLLSLITLTSYLILAITKFGLQNSAIYYYHDFKKNNNLEIFYNTFFWGTFLISIIVSILFIIITKILVVNINFFNKTLFLYYPIIILIVIIDAIFIRIRNFLRIEQKSSKFILLGVLKNYFSIITALSYFFFVSKTLKGFLIGIIIGNFILITCSILLLEWNLSNIKAFSYELFKKSLKYGYPFIFIELSSLLIKYADRYMIDIFLGTASVGVYSVAGNLCMNISNGIFSSIWLAISPIYMKLYKEKGIHETSTFISNSLTLLFFVFLPIIFGLTAISKDVITILATEKYISAAYLIPFLITGAAIWGITPIYGTGFYLEAKNNIYYKIMFFASLLNIILNLYMIPNYGLKGAAISTLIAYIVSFLLVIKLSFKLLKINTDYVALSHFLIGSLIMFLVIIILPLGTSIVNLLLKIFIGICIYLIVTYLLNDKIKNSINTYLLSKITF